MNTRVCFQAYFLKIAFDCADQATCLRRRYGAVIVDDENRIISTGYNGSPRKTIDCLELGQCWREKNNIESGCNYEKCRSVHAEMNAIINSTRDIFGCTIYLNGFDAKSESRINALPCFLCTKMLLNAGIEKLYNQDTVTGEPVLYSIRELYEEAAKGILS